MAAARLNPWIAYIAKQTGRPFRLTLPKDQELAQMQVKPANIQKAEAGGTKARAILAWQRELHVNKGSNEGAGQPGGGGRSELYIHVIPNWKEIGFQYRTNSIKTGPSRSNMQQEFKFGWEQMMDEMAEAVGMDPVQFRLLNVQKPGTKITHAQGGVTVTPMPESQNETLTYDSYASVEVLEEGQKVIGWDKRNPVPGGNPGRFKKGIGIAMSHHHAGRVGYHEGEAGFEKVMATTGGNQGGNVGAGGNGGGGGPYNGVVELNADGAVTLHYAQPDSGTNHGTAMSIQVGEILGFTTLDRIRVAWGDSELAPPAPGWNSGLTTQLQGGALNIAADKLRKDILQRAADVLKVDAARLQIRDGVISAAPPAEDTKKRITFADLVKANKGPIRQTGRCIQPGAIGRAMNRGIGACFLEVEVDTWTGDWRFIKAVYAHDSGKIVNPMVGEGDMTGSLVQSLQMATDALPYDREFPGTRHYSVGFLSF